ncbi:MAG: transposase [Spirochaetia bacterium]|nr:transposase [Spirochaetia bacterium]
MPQILESSDDLQNTKYINARQRFSLKRCLICNYHDSSTSNTPLHHLKLPLWVFSYLLEDQIHRFPQVLNAREIQERLGVSKNTASLLKRRLQVFLSDLTPAIKNKMAGELKHRGGLPSGDLTDFTRKTAVVHIDGLALFSASRRANGGRARIRHGGQTASVYLTDAVAEQKGRYQIGTLIHTIAIPGGPILLDSLPGFGQRYVSPLLEFLPADAPLFSDDGYPWLSRYRPNHRSVNHSARGKDKRNRWARQRWCRDGVNNNCAEGNQRALKHAFLSGYTYFSPEYSSLYVREYAGLKGIRVYGLQELLENTYGFGECGGKALTASGPPGRKHQHAYLRVRIRELQYLPPKPSSRFGLDYSNSRKQIRGKLRDLLNQNEFFSARQAHTDYLDFWEDAEPYRKQLEKKYNAVARELWSHLERWDGKLLSRLAADIQAPHRLLLRIARRWKKLGIARVDEQWNANERRIYCYVNRLTPVLPEFLYSFDMDQYQNQSEAELESIPAIEISKYGIRKTEREKLFNEVFS